MIIWITTIVGVLSTLVGCFVGYANYKKTRLETKKLEKASTVAELPPVSTPNDALISTLSILAKQLELNKSEVDTTRGEVLTLRTSLDACLGREKRRISKPI